MVLVRLTSAQVQLTESVVEIDEASSIIDLKWRIAQLFPADVEPIREAGRELKVIYFGRIINDTEVLKDVLRATSAYPSVGITTIHFVVQSMDGSSSTESRVPVAGSSIAETNAVEQPLREPDSRPHAEGNFSASPPHFTTSNTVPSIIEGSSAEGTYNQGVHSYDAIESPSGESYLVDQLETSSVVYHIELMDVENLTTSSVTIPSSQCIINDTGDHQPYALFTRTALAAISRALEVQLGTFEVNVISPTASTDHRGFNYHFRNTRINRWYNWRRRATSNWLFDGVRVFGYDFHNVSWTDLPFYLFEKTLESIERFYSAMLALTVSGGMSRLVVYLLGLLKFMFVLQIFNLRYELERKHPVLYNVLMLFSFVLTVLDDHNANNLRDILNRDFTNLSGRVYIMAILQRIKEFKSHLTARLSTVNSEVVSFVIGNNRPGLIINDHAHTYETSLMRAVAHHNQNKWIRMTTIFVQDILCFLITLIPKFYVVFNYEMIRRVTKVEREAMERANTEANFVTGGETVTATEMGDNENNSDAIDDGVNQSD